MNTMRGGQPREKTSADVRGRGRGPLLGVEVDPPNGRAMRIPRLQANVQGEGRPDFSLVRGSLLMPGVPHPLGGGRPAQRVVETQPPDWDRAPGLCQSSMGGQRDRLVPAVGGPRGRRGSAGGNGDGQPSTARGTDANRRSDRGWESGGGFEGLFLGGGDAAITTQPSPLPQKPPGGYSWWAVI